MVNRDELLDKYAAACVDGMDFQTLWTYAMETMRLDLANNYTTDEFSRVGDKTRYVLSRRSKPHPNKTRRNCNSFQSPFPSAYYRVIIQYMKNIYEIYEVPTGIAVADIRTGEIVNVWKPENRFMAVQFADTLNTLHKMNTANPT